MPRSSKPRRPFRPRPPGDIRLAATPWKIANVFAPIERVLGRLDIDGTIDVAQGRAVFREDMKGGWYEVVPALRGVVDFHALAAQRHGLQIDLTPLTKLANKLELGSPLFESDVTAVRTCIAECKRQAAKLTTNQADSILRTVQISVAMEEAA